MVKRVRLPDPPPPGTIDRDAEGGLDPRSPPYGFRVTPLGQWEQVTEQIAVIRLIARLRLEAGASYPVIAHRLNAAGIPSPKGGRKGWSASTVWRLLRRQTYWQRPDPNLAPDPWSAIRMAETIKVTGFLGDELAEPDR